MRNAPANLSCKVFALFVSVWSGVIVPVFPAYASLITPHEPASEVAAAKADDALRPLAEYARTAGSLLSAGSGTRAQDSLRGVAVGTATAEVEQWLSRVGTARVHIDVDRNFSLKNSELDLLFPWLETPDWLVFSQHSLHHTDDHNQMNTGAGVRHFGRAWMTGVNAFYDYDFSRRHSRGGVGAELWRDYLKFSTNSYFRLSSWRDAPELNNDYLARPASGWDVRTEGWLPAYPQLGGSLKYEQYYGKEVALYGRENRQRNPSSLTAGLSWTPVPLLTVNAEHSAGSGGINDSRAGVELNVSLGATLAEHLNPGAVRSSRMLSGSRLDLVEHNNNIVLDYQKKELIKLRLRQSPEGRPGERVALVEAVNTKYPLKHIEWNAPEFISAGGIIIGQDQTTQIQLPAYRLTTNPALAEKYNIYVIEGTAWDDRGNASSPARTEVVVSGDGVVAELMLSAQGTARADGKEVNTLTARVTDVKGNDVPESPVTFTLPPSLMMDQTDKASQTVIRTTDARGQAELKISTTVPGDYVVLAQAGSGNTVRAKTSTTFVADNGAAQIAAGHLTVESDGAVANGTATNSVKAIVTDSQGKAMAEQTVSFSADNGAVIAASGRTGADGSVTMPLTSTVPGVISVTATVNNSSQSVATTFVADNKTAEITAGNLTVLSDNAPANGVATNSVKAVVTDAAGNVVANQAVKFSADNGAAIADTGITGPDGSVEVTLTSTKAGTANVTASAGSSSQSVATTFVADSGTAQILAGNLTVVSDNAKADGTDTNSVKAVVTDAQGNLVANQSVSFKADNGADITPQGTTGPDGSITVALMSTVAGSSTVTATVNNSSQSVVTTFRVLLPQFTLAASTHNNPHDYAAGSGFPTTGFTGATFTVDIPAGSSANDYQWVAQRGDGTTASWLSVEQTGRVTFNTQPSAAEKSVEIIATPKAGGQPLGYRFTLQSWFTYHNVSVVYADAEALCASTRASLPTMQQYNGGTQPYGEYHRGTPGGLWSEWGAQRAYYSFIDAWSQDVSGLDWHFILMDDGYWTTWRDDIPLYGVLCRQQL